MYRSRYKYNVNISFTIYLVGGIIGFWGRLNIFLFKCTDVFPFDRLLKSNADPDAKVDNLLNLNRIKNIRAIVRMCFVNKLKNSNVRRFPYMNSQERLMVVFAPYLRRTWFESSPSDHGSYCFDLFRVFSFAHSVFDGCTHKTHK